MLILLQLYDHSRGISMRIGGWCFIRAVATCNDMLNSEVFTSGLVTICLPVHVLEKNSLLLILWKYGVKSSLHQ